jgi:hypothetical protein
MTKITADVRLRPIRYAFLVRPTARNEIMKIFRINACLWGGKYNPIIPFFSQIPKWWSKDGHGQQSADKIINDYLDFFEPDFVVETDTGMAAKFGFAENRILQIDKILPSAQQAYGEGHGLTVLDLYRELYSKEFQFKRRHDKDIVDSVARDRKFDIFSAGVLGAFPDDAKYSYLHRAFKEAFDPKAVNLDGDTYAGLIGKATSALRLGHSDLEIDTHGRNEPSIFILDANSPRDMIDYWNRRAAGGNIVPIPIQWITSLSALCKQIITDSYGPLPNNNHGVMTRASVSYSSSIAEPYASEAHKHLLVDVDGAMSQTAHSSLFWRPRPGRQFDQTRPIVTARKREFDLPLDKDQRSIRFESLSPEYADRYGCKDRWANVVKLSTWSDGDQLATTFPIAYRDPKFPHFGIGGDDLLTTSEGLVTFPHYIDAPHYWNLQDGSEAIGSWLDTNGISASLSDAGRSTQQVIRTLGGFRGVSSIAASGIVKLLNEIARRPLLKSMQDQEFKNRITKAAKEDGDIWRGREFESLVNHRAVELGAEVRCTKCSGWSWFSLAQIDSLLTCQACLQAFPFPVIDPSSSAHSKWAYRVIGPFAQPDYARGGYAAALALRFFSVAIGGFGDSGLTWSAGQELTLSPSRKVEADMIAWYQRKRVLGLDQPIDIVFGEAKSFGREAFQNEDIENLKTLAIRFPGAILVCATMKQASEFSESELLRLRRLALWGREYMPRTWKSRAPLIILTGNELFCPYRLELAWKEMGGKHQELIEPAYVRTDSLRVLADLTQQLYLGLPSYSDWQSAKWNRIRERRNRSRPADDSTGSIEPSAPDIEKSAD